MKSMTLTGSAPNSAKLNWHSRTLLEILVISVLCVIIFNLRTRLLTQDYVQKRELVAKELNTATEILQLVTPTEASVIKVRARDSSPEPAKSLSPSERRALESPQKGIWTE